MGREKVMAVEGKGEEGGIGRERLRKQLHSPPYFLNALISTCLVNVPLYVPYRYRYMYSPYVLVEYKLEINSKP
jgi:hypothetical protein